ncbi:MAG TPA: thioesterase family protein [Candidatus Kapabacteria bacterium]|nr:thioesterase family protein [Candidatus Kapabacteria bacterium]
MKDHPSNGYIEHVTHIRVRYADTDQMGMVYYGKYFEYFEVARTEMLRACGLPYAEIEAAGFWLPVSEASAKYYHAAKYDDLLRVTARMPHVVSPRLEISYEARLDATEELIATGATTLVFVSSATGKPTRPPQIYRDAIERNTTH